MYICDISLKNRLLNAVHLRLLILTLYLYETYTYYKCPVTHDGNSRDRRTPSGEEKMTNAERYI